MCGVCTVKNLVETDIYTGKDLVIRFYRIGSSLFIRSGKFFITKQIVMPVISNNY